jgi:cyanophycinase-like exopeptidase
MKMNVVVSVEDGYMDRLSEVAKGLENAGMNVEQKLGQIGIISGSVDDTEKVELLREVKGVSHVEEAREITIPPPDSPIQ